MKRVVLMIIPALICGVMFFFVSSCNKESNTDSALYFKAFYPNVDTRTYSAEQEDASKSDIILLFTGNDIKWYNATTGELKFNNIPNLPYPTFSRLDIYLDDFMLLSFRVASPFSSISTAFPCINAEFDGEQKYKGCKCGNKQDHIPGPNCESIWDYTGEGVRYYISRGYPRWDPKDRGVETSHWNWESIDAEREKNWKAIEPEWNLFIQQLKKEGKYRK
jgi:hypothetical protein